MPPRTPHAIHEGDVGIHAYAGAGAGLGGELKTVPEDFIVTELLQDGREVMLEDPDGAGEDAVADEEEDEWDDEQLVKFVLRKEKQDTLGAVADLAEELGVPERAFSYAGLKDYHAITTQELVVQGVPPSRLRALRLVKLQLGRIRIAERKLRLGECGGNRFRLRLRRVRARGARAVDVAFGTLRDTGFINYFGLQRFGSNIARNDEVGRALLLCDYVQAWPALSPRLRLSFRPSPRQRSASCSRLHHPASRPRRRRPWRACSRTRATG